MEVPDEDLAIAAAGGDGRAFGLLIERHYDHIFRLAFRFTGQREEAEDLTQDICAALPARLMRFEARARFRTWLYRVIFNAAQDRRRRQAAQAKAADGWGKAEPNRHAEAREKYEALNWLQSAMTTMPAELRDTAALVLDELSHAEVAEILGISEGTVSWRMSEVRKHLRALKEQER